MISRKFFILCFAAAILQGCAASKKTQKEIAPVPYQAMKEFRAAWVATVANINWPSKPGLSSDEQKREALELLDFLKQHHFNAVILQVRPQCDALYKSELEPWSYYLTGQQGLAPSPYYDPLEFWTEAAHDRGLELHAWLNPYRAHHKDGNEISAESIVKKRPELVVKLKEGYWWLDPAQKGTQEHSMAVVMDLVRRYDIDGIHFDDYFYPYPSYNGGADFPDSTSWAAYQQSGGNLSRGDWRRNAVNIFIEQLYKNIKSEKPNIRFGLSPFGIWRPGHPSSIEGFDQYEQLYADAKLWLNNGWIDYFTPQLYWPINRIPQSFPVLLGWWAEQNNKQRHLWPGISVGRDSSAKNVNEIMSQVMITRGMIPASKGVVHWSISSLTKNPNMAKALLEGPYRKDAISPASAWLDNIAPAVPTVKFQWEQEQLNISWDHTDVKDIFRWIVYQQYGSNWSYTIMNRGDRNLLVKKRLNDSANSPVLSRIAVSAVDRMGNESEIKEIIVQ